MIKNYNEFSWRVKSFLIKKRDDFKCQICEIDKNLHVHHILYLDRQLWDYPSNYLITLCNHCHIAEHAAFDLIGKNYKEALLSGMLAIDIYRKIKSKETLINSEEMLKF